MEKAVRGATKSKRAPPKPKYVQVLISATSNEKNLEVIIKCLNQRLREQSWTVVFKSLIVIHILMKEGATTRVLKALANESTILNVSGFHGMEQTKNIHAYAAYLGESVSVYRELKVDYATTRSGVSRLRNLTVAKGLLREVKLVQKQLGALLNCRSLFDSSNEVTICAFKLLVHDLLDLFQAVNEGVINVLEYFMEMSRIDANTALQIYRTFVKQTAKVVELFAIARNSIGMKIPNLKHANVSLTDTLEDYFKDPNFEINREEYRLSKEDRSKNPKKVDNSSNPSESAPKKEQTGTAKFTPTVETKTQKETNFDFFASIEQEQITIFGDQYNSPYVAQSLTDQSVTNPFLIFRNQTNESPLAPQINQYALSPHVSSVQDTNPFRSSIFSPSTPGVVPVVTTVGQYNPFQSSLPTSNETNPFVSVNSVDQLQQQQQFYQQPTSQTTSYSSITVDSNPFRRLSTAPGFQSTQTPFSQSLTVQDSPAIIQNPINTSDPTFPHIQFQQY